MSILDQVVPDKQAQTASIDVNQGQSVESISLIAQEITVVKSQIANLNQRKAELEASMITVVGQPQQAGTFKYGTDDFNVTLTQSATRKIIDANELRKVAPEIVRDEPKIDARKLNSLAMGDPDRYQLAQRYIETKMAKPSLKIEATKP